MRACDGKKDMLVIDHAGCVLYHGFPDIDREWPLAETDNIDKPNPTNKPPAPLPIKCPQCQALFSGTRTCPECGYLCTPQKKPKDYAKKNGTLIELSSGDLPQDTATLLYQRYWGTCIATAIKRNRHAGAAAGMFKGKFGIPPWQAKVHPLPGFDEWKQSARDVFPGFVREKV